MDVLIDVINFVWQNRDPIEKMRQLILEREIATTEELKVCSIFLCFWHTTVADVVFTLVYYTWVLLCGILGIL